MMICMRSSSSQLYLDLIAALLLSALIASASFHAGIVQKLLVRGPHNWGNLSPEWRMCSDGRSQSPVEIKKKELVLNVKHKLDFHYTSGPATLKIKKHFVELMEEFPYLHGSGETKHHVGNASTSGMKLGDQFYHYMGSLTTPPCTEGVTWIIMKKERNVSHQQVNELLRAELGENARPLQPLNGRTIYKSYDR